MLEGVDRVVAIDLRRADAGFSGVTSPSASWSPKTLWGAGISSSAVVADVATEAGGSPATPGPPPIAVSINARKPRPGGGHVIGGVEGCPIYRQRHDLFAITIKDRGQGALNKRAADIQVFTRVRSLPHRLWAAHFIREVFVDTVPPRGELEEDHWSRR